MDKATREKIKEDKCKEREEKRLKRATNLGFVVDRIGQKKLRNGLEHSLSSLDFNIYEGSG
jgi:hypothetical protein